MLQSNPECVRKALEIFRRGFTPFVERQMIDLDEPFWSEEVHLDTQALAKIMLDNWDSIFGELLGSGGRRRIYKVRDVRNMWAHEEPLTTTDVYYLLEDIRDLLTRISAHQEAREIDQLQQEIEYEPIELVPQRQAEWAVLEWEQTQI